MAIFFKKRLSVFQIYLFPVNYFSFFSLYDYEFNPITGKAGEHK